MLPILIVPFTLLWICEADIVRSHETTISIFSARQTCHATCSAFTAEKEACRVEHCGCKVDYLRAQGDCYVCMTGTAQDAAAVKLFLDVEINQCRRDGIPVDFKLQLPPDAQAIVDEFDRQSADLRRKQTAFLAQQIVGGHIGLVIVLLLAVFSRQVSRNPTFFNFCLTWIFSSIVYSVLLYRGTEGNTVVNTISGVQPQMCLAQAALTNGAQVMTACSTMAMVAQLWMGLRATIHGDLAREPVQSQWTTFLLLGLPYVLFIASAIPSIFVGRMQTIIQTISIQRALPGNFYCSVVGPSSFLRAIYGMTFGLLIVATIFDFLIVIILYQHWRAFRHDRKTDAVSLSVLSRVIVFSIYRLVVAVTYGTVLEKPPQVVRQAGSGDTLSVILGVPTWIDMLQATIPLVGFLVLGVNADLISILTPWRRKLGRETVSSLKEFNTTSNSVDLVLDISRRNV